MVLDDFFLKAKSPYFFPWGTEWHSYGAEPIVEVVVNLQRKISRAPIWSPWLDFVDLSPSEDNSRLESKP
jgi:hypothetical protein